MRRPRLLALAPLLMLASCGGGHHHQAPGHRLVTSVAGHPCTPAHEAMRCVLSRQPPPRAGLRAPAATSARGIDFAWSCPSPHGWSFGASYLSDSSKDWTRGCLGSYRSAGAASVFVRETSANRAQGGCSAGQADARSAAQELLSLGIPGPQPFTMAIDFDSPGWDVASYFACASQAEPGRVNAYGGYRPLLYLWQHHDVGSLNWQTYAWSGGQWLPASIAPLEQYLNDNSVDYDRALATDYGQYPRPAPPPPPDPFRIAIFPTGAFSYQGHKLPGEQEIARAYDQRRPGHPIATDGKSAHYAREACLAQDRIWRLVRGGHHSSKFPEWRQANRIERWPYLESLCRGRQALKDFKP